MLDKCNICDANFSQKGSLNKHIESVHEGKKPYKYTVCDSNFSTKQNLNRHNKSVHKGKEPFKCLWCNIFWKKRCEYKQSFRS